MPAPDPVLLDDVVAAEDGQLLVTPEHPAKRPLARAEVAALHVVATPRADQLQPAFRDVVVGSVVVDGENLRQAVRALVLDPSDNLLLVHFEWKGLDIPGGFWACPGGGIDPGESHEQALRRELSEELGLDDIELVGPAWHLTRIFPMTEWDGQIDFTYVVRTPHFEPRPRVDLAEENVSGVRWFSRTELQDATTTFSPRDLASQLSDVLREGGRSTSREILALD